MKRALVMAVLGLVAAGLGYGLVGMRRAPAPAALADVRGTDLAWIRTEFGLNDSQFAAVEALHRDYAVVCTRHCADILAAQEEVARLRQTQAPAGQLQAAQAREREFEEVCNTATRAHLEKVAAAMPPEQGRRFLAMVMPHLAQQPHDGMRGMGR